MAIEFVVIASNLLVSDSADAQTYGWDSGTIIHVRVQRAIFYVYGFRHMGKPIKTDTSVIYFD
jgi:hypothetical protein